MMNPLDDLLTTAAKKPEPPTQEPVPAGQDEPASPGPKREDSADTLRDEKRKATEEERLIAECDRYAAMLPAIAAAQPLAAEWTPEAPLSGVEWLVDGVRRALPVPDDSPFTVDVAVNGHAISAAITCPPGTDRREMAALALNELHGRGNLGTFTAKYAEDGVTIYLDRENVTGAHLAWKAHGTAARLFLDRDGQRKVFNTAGLFQTNQRTKARRWPAVTEWSEDARGGTARLSLPPGMTIAQVVAATGKLAQALRAPDLVVDAAPGTVDPVLHLNTAPLRTELPKSAALDPSMFTRARTEAEQYAAAKDFTLPIGVRTDPETGRMVLLTANLDVTPHGAVFGPTGSGKTVWLAICVRAAAIQGCADIILWDAKEGSDLRELATDPTIPGIVHYAVGDTSKPAPLHRAVLFMRDEFDRRKRIAKRLAHRGIKYRPRPLLVVMDELPAFIRDMKQMGGDSAKAAKLTEARLDYMGSQARELRIFFIVAGQTAYVEGYPGSIRANTRTLIQLGEPEAVNINALFVGKEKAAMELAGTITPDDRGVGVVMDPHTRRPVLFRGFFNAPGTPDAERFDAALRQAPRHRRWAYQLPRGAEAGGDGTWVQWHPLSEPSSDDLQAVWLDDENLRPYPDRVRDDPNSPDYDPGAEPAPERHLS
ncbi:hypothetical protein E3G50_003194 [Mycobacteroides abscessus]|nr:hypothetical protein [Mycobacteroides abscessus]